jgi:hypothetical protein
LSQFQSGLPQGNGRRASASAHDSIKLPHYTDNVNNDLIALMAGRPSITLLLGAAWLRAPVESGSDLVCSKSIMFESVDND